MPAKQKKPRTEVEKMKLVAYVRQGLTLNEIAGIYGVKHETIWKWLHCDSGMIALTDAAQADSGWALFEQAQEILSNYSADQLEDPVTGKIVMNTVKFQRDKALAELLMKKSGLLDKKYNDKASSINVHHDMRDVFMGLVIKPPTIEDDETGQIEHIIDITDDGDED